MDYYTNGFTLAISFLSCFEQWVMIQMGLLYFTHMSLVPYKFSLLDYKGGKIVDWFIKEKRRSKTVAIRKTRERREQKQKKCRWGSITATTVTKNFKTLQLPVNAISKAPLTSAPNLSDPNQAHTNGAAGGFTKGVCNRFVKTGFCPFGDSCKYLHPTTTTNNLQSTGLMDNPQSPFIPGNQSLQDDVVRDNMGMSWGNLPPSLKPPPEGGYLPLPFVDWG
ncbi:uncharacterized protein LOC8274945 isoform X1 [Ricinus communis]|uniref:uncharacterized protein LOC8274945 isoform X1 n=1 Tax=Ricinus communis TaxID=3988 RepID=UPI00201B298A|nr:uncharacterized protein LOC8274945 isoform X1 [Ricinus communis]